MEAIVSRAAGIDIGKAVLKATVRVQGEHGRKTSREVRTFGTTTGQLLVLRDWLVAEGVTLVGMESTGVFWKPVYYMLEDVAECWLLNAQHLKKVLGRKKRCQRLGVDRGDGGTRSGAVELCAAARHTPAARAD